MTRAVTTNFLTYRRLALKWKCLIARRHAKFNILFDPERIHVFAIVKGNRYGHLNNARTVQCRFCVKNELKEQ